MTSTVMQDLFAYSQNAQFLLRNGAHTRTVGKSFNG